MPFFNFISKNSICIDSTARSKTATLLKISQIFNQNHPELDIETLFNAYWKRESMGSTTIGHGIMIPHIRVESINTIYGCLLKLEHPIDFGAEDKQPIHLVFGLVVGANQTTAHLQTLAKLAKQCSIPSFRSACRKATSCHQLHALLTENISEPLAEEI